VGRNRLPFTVPGRQATLGLRGWDKTLAPHTPAHGRHPLADRELTEHLRRRALEIGAAFDRIEPEVKALAEEQFAEDFATVGSARIKRQLGLDLPPNVFKTSWSAPLDARALYARCVLGTFCRLIEREFDRDLARMSEGESAEELIRRWGFHAIDVTPCADGRLSGVIDYILRIPPAVIAYRKSYAGALFDVEESLRHWETVELRRWREGEPNAADTPTQYLKVGIYHFSSLDPHHEGCAAHGSDTVRAATAVLTRLQEFQEAVAQTHCCEATAATLLIGVDTDTDAIRLHVPDAQGLMAVDRYVNNLALFEETRMLSRDAAKDAIRSMVAQCAGVPIDDAATEGSRWFCGYLLKNNVGQIDAVRDWHGAAYSDNGHTERLIIVGDAVDDVQLRNLAFQAQMDTVEEGAVDLDIGVKVLRALHEPLGLSVPILVHLRYDPRIPGSRIRAAARARRLQSAIEARYPELGAGSVFVQSVIRAGTGAELSRVEFALPSDTQSTAETSL
jgi:carboxysome shell carbonic anhydrase